MSDVSLDGTWVVVKYRSGDRLVTPVSDGPDPTLTIDGNGIAGSMGINRLVGRLEDGSIAGPLATTRMAGPPEIMEQENELLSLLHRVDEVIVERPGMTMRCEGLDLVKLRLTGTITTDGSS